MSKIDLRMFDVVRLKDGREGTVVDIYEVPSEPIGYEIEILGSEMELVTVHAEDIKEKTWKAP